MSVRTMVAHCWLANTNLMFKLPRDQGAEPDLLKIELHTQLHWNISKDNHCFLADQIREDST